MATPLPHPARNPRQQRPDARQPWHGATTRAMSAHEPDESGESKDPRRVEVGRRNHAFQAPAMA